MTSYIGNKPTNVPLTVTDVPDLPASKTTSGQFADGRISSSSVTQHVTSGIARPTVTNTSITIAPDTSQTFTITGTNFVSIPRVELINASTGAIVVAGAVSFTSASLIDATVNVPSATYKIKVENGDGGAVTTGNIVRVSNPPTWSTSAGSLGTFAGNYSGTLATLSASGDSTISYSETTSVLSGAGVSLDSSTGVLSTTDFGGSSTTPQLYTFTIRATESTDGQYTDREFTLQSSFGASGGGQFN